MENRSNLIEIAIVDWNSLLDSESDQIDDRIWNPNLIQRRPFNLETLIALA